MEKTASQKLDVSLLFGLYCALLVVAFSFTISSMAAPYIVLDLGGSPEISIYTVVFYGIGSAISIPLGKPLASRFTSGRTLVFCLLFEALFTWGAAMAPTYPIFILFRFFQGIAGGPFYPLLNHLFASLVPKQKRPLITSIFVTILAIVPAIGTCWGGFIAYEYVWPWMFTLNIPLILLLAALLWLKLENLPFAPQKQPFDLFGYCFYGIGMLCLSLSVTMAQQLDWYRSPLLVTLTLIGAPCFLFFLLWTWFHPNPVLDLRLFKNPVFCFTMFNLAVLFSVYFGMITLIPQWLKLYASYTPNWIVAIIGGMALGGLFPRYLLENKLGRIDCRWPLGVAIIFLAISAFHTTIFDTDINFGRIAFSRIIGGFGLALFLPPLFQLAFKNVPENKLIDVIGVFQVCRNLAAGLGAGIYDICWQRRQIFFHERLGEKLTVFSQLTKNFFAKAKQFWEPGDRYALLGDKLQQEATSLALDDIFWLMAWILVALLVILLLTIPCKKESFMPEDS